METDLISEFRKFMHDSSNKEEVNKILKYCMIDIDEIIKWYTLWVKQGKPETSDNEAFENFRDMCDSAYYSSDDDMCYFGHCVSRFF